MSIVWSKLSLQVHANLIMIWFPCPLGRLIGKFVFITYVIFLTAIPTARID